VAGSFTIGGNASGLLSGSKTLAPNTMYGGAPVGTILDATLATGDNTFAVPSTAVAVAVFIQTTNVAAIKIRTNLNSADAGLPVNPAGPWAAFPLYSGTTSVILNAASGGALVELNFI
jgi:hypothetical protein